MFKPKYNHKPRFKVGDRLVWNGTEDFYLSGNMRTDGITICAVNTDHLPYYTSNKGGALQAAWVDGLFKLATDKETA